MNTALAGAVSAALLLAFTTMASAEPARYRPRHHYDNDLAYRYPYATQRQLHNERAYQKGEYWEKDSNALIPGTRAWFEQKERESAARSDRPDVRRELRATHFSAAPAGVSGDPPIERWRATRPGWSGASAGENSAPIRLPSDHTTFAVRR